MMTNRKILYGYQMKEGFLVPIDTEAQVVVNVFTQYCNGLSYQGIADTLSRASIPYSHDCPVWNKHKIKRMLEDSRYIGRAGYPPIISDELLQAVQDIIRSKQPVKQELPAPVDVPPPPPLHTTYSSPQEALLLDRRINQALNQDAPAEQVIALILQGVNARYQGIQFIGKEVSP